MKMALFLRTRDAIGTNLYAWCNNNPVNRVDPSGLASLLERVNQSVQAACDYVGIPYSGTRPSIQASPGYRGYSRGLMARSVFKRFVVKTAVAEKAPSRDQLINNLRNLSVAGITPLKQPVLTNYSGMFGSEVNVSPGGEAMLGGVTMMLGAERVYRGFTGAETSQQSVKKGVREVNGIEGLDGCQCLVESKNNIAFGGSLILVGAAMEVDASIRYFEDTVDKFINKAGD